MSAHDEWRRQRDIEAEGQRAARPQRRGYEPAIEAPPAPDICPRCDSANIRKTPDGWWCERCREREYEEWLAW